MGCEIPYRNIFPDANIDTFSFPSKAKSFLENRQVDLLIIDLEYNNGECGINFVRQLNSGRKKIRAVAYTSHQVNQILLDIKKSGFTSYLNKDVSTSEICAEVDKILSLKANQFYESASYCKHRNALIEKQNKYFCSDYEKLKSLTKKEKNALILIAEDHTASNEQLASKLGIQLNTMKKHLSNIYSKLNLKSKDGLKIFKERVIKEK